jgi:hypothetical protein
MDTSLLSSSTKPLSIVGQLARVHSLFAYQTIGLIDGDICSRHLAEQRFPIFVRWLTELLDCASNSIVQSLLSWELDTIMSSTSGRFNLRECVWQAWIVAESIRRTWLVGTGLQAAYDGLKQGYTPCPGGVMFTCREGVWEAKSAFAWEKLCTETNVRFIKRFETESLFDETVPDEVNDFCKMVLEITYGRERMEEWLSRTSSRG